MVKALGDAARSADIFASSVKRSAAIDQAELQKLQVSHDNILRDLTQVQEELRRLLAIFKAEEAIPLLMKEECLRLEGEGERLQGELEVVDLEIEDMVREETDPVEFRTRLTALTDLLPDLPLATQKQVLQGAIRRISVNQVRPKKPKSPTSEGGLRSVIRTKTFLVNILLAGSPHLERCVNQTGGFPGYFRIGSLIRPTARTTSRPSFSRSQSGLRSVCPGGRGSREPSLPAPSSRLWSSGDCSTRGWLPTRRSWHASTASPLPGSAK